MAKAFTKLSLSLAAWASLNVVAIAEPAACKDCNPETGLTIREQIKVDRAREVERIAKETTTRPWDGLDLGYVKRTSTPPVVR